MTRTTATPYRSIIGDFGDDDDDDYVESDDDVESNDDVESDDDGDEDAAVCIIK